MVSAQDGGFAIARGSIAARPIGGARRRRSRPVAGVMVVPRATRAIAPGDHRDTQIGGDGRLHRAG